jgi:hypothetical protein
MDKWEDTVAEVARHLKVYFGSGYSEDDYRAIAEHLVKAPYKAGMQKGVDWLSQQPIFMYSISKDATLPLNECPEWQAFLKENGLEVK